MEDGKDSFRAGGVTVPLKFKGRHGSEELAEGFVLAVAVMVEYSDGDSALPLLSSSPPWAQE